MLGSSTPGKQEEINVGRTMPGEYQAAQVFFFCINLIKKITNRELVIFVLF